VGRLTLVRVPDLMVLRRVTDVSVFLGYVPPGSRRYVTFDGVTVVVDMLEGLVSLSGSPACVGGWRLRLGGGVYEFAV
jgi:hypothetical protein